MELTKELVEEHKLTDEQVTAVNEFGKTHTDTLVADTKKEYDGKATKDADGILDGAAEKITEVTKVKREQGEKIVDFIGRAWDDFSKEGKTALEKSKKEYDDKVTNFEGDSNLKAEIITLKEKLDPLQIKEADYDKMLNSGVQKNYDELVVKHESQNQQLAFGSVKPSFHKDSNEFEVTAKWNEFIKETEEKYDIVFVDDIATGVSKDNKYKNVPLKELVKENKALTELISGREQEGIGASQSSETLTIEGVPFEVPKDADSATITKLIREHLLKEGTKQMDPAYSKKFAEINKKVRAAL